MLAHTHTNLLQDRWTDGFLNVIDYFMDASGAGANEMNGQ